MSIKKMNVAEFRKEGYLQELNRQFLHPLGLALEVVVNDDGSEHIGGIWDYRDDPEGILFGDIDVDKAERIEEIWKDREPARQAKLGYMVQPLPDALMDAGTTSKGS